VAGNPGTDGNPGTSMIGKGNRGQETGDDLHGAPHLPAVGRCGCFCSPVSHSATCSPSLTMITAAVILSLHARVQGVVSLGRV